MFHQIETLSVFPQATHSVVSVNSYLQLTGQISRITLLFDIFCQLKSLGKKFIFIMITTAAKLNNDLFEHHWQGRVALLVAHPTDATPPLGKINPFHLYCRTF